MCATKTCSLVLAVSAPSRVRWKRLTFMKVMIIMVEAFQEALDMRRIAQRTFFLSGE
jgi:hypothetical protein